MVGKDLKIIKNEKTKLLDNYYTELYENGRFNGNVLVAEKGNIIFQKSFGIKSEETREKLDLETVFDIASVTKQFTAAGIMLLVRENKLSLSDLFTKYVPEFSFYENITIENLLTHTSGIPDNLDVMDEKWEDKNVIADNDAVIKFF